MAALEVGLGATIVAALVLYFLLGGADFGGGVWDLLASGPRRHDQRSVIDHAIGPVWEANHVWLILVVVILFTGFPVAFAALSIAAMLYGLWLRAGRPSGVSEAERIAAAPELVAGAASARAGDRS